MEIIISCKKLSPLFLFPGIIYGKIQQLVKLPARKWPFKEDLRGRNCASIHSKVEAKKRGSRRDGRVHIPISEVYLALFM